ncbi:hypothetical protein HNP84_005420 [Thermocatellispora tengchongensis]|uniref:Uncharacterized protein n=2 Tax=Thermocatellispora tengchongensis TaxID=1073253 RepID=A0A840PAH5_9ACTN|nr:hypothetical protein [Thermocatellispora tengchongensis]MBB5135676.1 hypothetical protein [Thermocatellispora tengchongensis]
MTHSPAAGLAVSIRRCALLVLTLAVTAGCGLTGGGAAPDPPSTAQATSDATPAAERSTPAVTESAPAETATGPETTGGSDGTTGTAVSPGGVLTDGSTVSAELTRAGQKHEFTLRLGDAREFYVADMQGSGIRLQVFSEVDGQPLGPSPAALDYGTTIFKLTKAGGHRLEIWGDTNVIGPYSFRIATVKVRTFPATIGLKIGAGSPDGAGQLDVPGRIDRFEFDADGAPAIKVLGGAGACPVLEMELYDAAERNVATARQPFPLCGYEFDIPLSGDGRYALVVRSGTAKTGAYSFQIVRAG